MPTVTLCTDEFLGLAGLRLEAAGLPARRLVAVPHPLAGLAPDRVAERAAAAADDVARLLEG